MRGTNVCSAGEAARMLGVTRQRVYALLDRGQLSFVRQGSQRLVCVESVDARLALLAVRAEIRDVRRQLACRRAPRG